VASGYRAVLAGRLRSQLSYRLNFWIDLVTSGLVGLAELAEVAIVFLAVTTLGGVDLPAALLMFGIAETAFSLADLVFGHCDEIPRYLREGTWDVFYLRPQPLLLQLITSDLSLRRLARTAVGLVLLGIGCRWSGLELTFSSVFVLTVSVVSGIVLFAGLFVWAAGIQFFLVQGSEATNAVVYGGRYASTQPASVWSRPLQFVFGYLFPVAFVAYLPVSYPLGIPTFGELPSGVAWLAPVAACWMWLLGLASWWAGVRHYQGGGG
jgi:ABC-2 type transport system permease protein